MTTHIAVEEGRDIEEVASWSARRRLLHAQMLGAYNQFKQQQAESQSGGDQHPYGDMSEMQQMGQMPGQHAHAQAQAQANAQPQDIPSPPGQQSVPTSPGAAGGADPTSRHGMQFDVDTDDDTDWQLCQQCQGLFEPGEYDAHFDQPDFDCVRR